MDKVRMKGVSWNRTDRTWQVQIDGRAFGCNKDLALANLQAQGVHDYFRAKGQLPPVGWRVAGWTTQHGKGKTAS